MGDLKDRIKYDLKAHPLDRNPVVLAQAADRIAELEAQLKTAKRDGILEAIAKVLGYLVPNDFQSDWVYSSDDLVEYANSLKGEEELTSLDDMFKLAGVDDNDDFANFLTGEE